MDESSVSEIRARVKALEHVVTAMLLAYGDKDDATFMREILDAIKGPTSRLGADEETQAQMDRTFHTCQAILDIKLAED